MENNTARAASAWKTIDLVYIALFAVLITVCSWISIPAAVPFTLQTFGVFVTARILGGKKACLSIIVYLLLGAIGLPVFAGFKSGAAALLGTTGGYLIGFIFTALFLWITESFTENRPVLTILFMVIGLAICYLFGTVWFMQVYARNSGPVGLMTALGWCVFPFIIPDLIKIALAYIVGTRVKTLLRNI